MAARHLTPTIEERLRDAGENVALVARLMYAESVATAAGAGYLRDPIRELSSDCLCRLTMEAFDHIAAVVVVLSSSSALNAEAAARKDVD